MQYPNVRTAVAALCLCVAGAAQAAAPTLIGDTLNFMRAYPDSFTQFGPSIPSTTVAAGSSDAVSWLDYVFIDPEADHISFTVPGQTNFMGGGPIFDGFVVSGLDHDLESVAVLSNTTGFGITLTHDLRSFKVDLSPANGYSSGQWVIGVTLADSPPPIPEPATSALAAAGLGALALWRLRTSRPPRRSLVPWSRRGAAASHKPGL